MTSLAIAFAVAMSPCGLYCRSRSRSPSTKPRERSPSNTPLTPSSRASTEARCTSATRNGRAAAAAADGVPRRESRSEGQQYSGRESDEQETEPEAFQRADKNTRGHLSEETRCLTGSTPYRGQPGTIEVDSDCIACEGARDLRRHSNMSMIGSFRRLCERGAVICRSILQREATA